ncbi:rDD family protein [Catenibacterium sp. CAG:290]|uniref:RDD family protein n=1 Tax=Catenibacterium sp. CAG:290 TaxID=1262767 RepID=UPI00033E5DF2|nr:RDD family protein [Catenibacterium sp. CAG:290]CDE27457.1 rDD family protein [Catenibacterium sp. CAG:290]
MWNKLRNEPVNKTGYIKGIIAYGIDWYLGSVLSSLPLILLYMSLHKDAVYIPQQLSIFKGYYQVIAGVLSLSVAFVYYVVLPIIWKGQTVGKKLLGLKIVNDNYQEVNVKQLIIRQVIMIFLVEGSIYTCSNMLHQLVNVLTGYNIASIWNKVGLVITILSGILVIVLKSKKSLHDIVSHTLVVDIKSEDYKNMLLSIEKKNKKQNKKMKKRFA